ncbi:MAG: sulfatase [Planctomycetes bacterium]|nr:sulfatase [Planctomycetota bacterium]
MIHRAMVGGWRSWSLAGSLAWSLAAAPLPAQVPAAPPDGKVRRDLLVITLDTTRRDFLGCYGREPSRTLNLDYLARRSVVFEDAVTTVPVTLPSHASLFTGLYPTTHGVRYNSGYKLPDEARTLAELLREVGYATRAEVAAYVLDPIFGLAQGFDRYRAPPRAVSRPGAPAKEEELPAAAIVDRLLEDVAELAPAGGPPDGSRKPFFLWGHFYDPHLPYAAKSPPKIDADQARDPQQVARALYEAELADVDAELGRLFRELAARQLMDQLVVLVVADHGEGLGDGLEQAHGFFLFDATVRIPMILRHPALPAMQVKVPASLIDMTPTLLTVLGVDAAAERFDGLDLLPWISDAERPAPERALMLESMYAWLNFGWAPQFGCTLGPLKYLRSVQEELYDRLADPAEAKNLFSPGEPRAAALARRLQEHLAKASPLASSATATLSEADKRRLEALGYAAGGGSTELPEEWSSLPDPYQKIAAYERMNAAVSAAAQQGLDATVAALRAAVAEDPRSAPLHEQIGLMLSAAPQRHAEAAAAFDAALAIDPRRARSWFGRAQCAQLAADAARAQAAQARTAGGPAAAKPFVEAERKELDHAELALRRALDCDPDYPDALAALSRQLAVRAERLLQRKENAAAIPLVREAVELLARLTVVLPSNTPEWADASARRVQLQRALDSLTRGG